MCNLPIKLPAVKDKVSLISLPMLGYLEQTVAKSIISALHAVGSTKPKYPFLSKSKSALIYMALYLKGNVTYNSMYVGLNNRSTIS